MPTVLPPWCTAMLAGIRNSTMATMRRGCDRLTDSPSEYIGKSAFGTAVCHRSCRWAMIGMAAIGRRLKRRGIGDGANRRHELALFTHAGELDWRMQLAAVCLMAHGWNQASPRL